MTMRRLEFKVILKSKGVVGGEWGTKGEVKGMVLRRRGFKEMVLRLKGLKGIRLHAVLVKKKKNEGGKQVKDEREIL